MHPIFVVLLDGLADRAHDSLGGRTANEVADTPNLDRLAATGSCGLIYGVGPGRAPSSEIAHWAMLGYTPEEFPGRAVLEAVGAEQDVDPEHVLAFAALRPAEQRPDGLWLTGRPGKGGEDEDDAAELVAACAGLDVDDLRFELTHRPPRRGDPPSLPGRGRPSHRLRCVLQGPLPGAAAAGPGAGGRANGPGCGGLDEDDD